MTAPGPSQGRVATMRVLGIETSCDETAAAVVEGPALGIGAGPAAPASAAGAAADATPGDIRVLSSVVSSQIDLHARYGGVVPEIASRAHLELLNPVVAQALLEAAVEGAPDAVAATVGPGLIGSLLVGVSAAKAMALVWGVPFVGVNHMEGHLYASFLEDPGLQPPLVVLLVSGGHTMLVLMEGHGRYRLLGQTVDDAAGEAFDKVARFLGLGYPGGPAIEAAARDGDPAAVAFPRSLLGEGFDFSFSGLKTSVIRYVHAHPEVSVADVAASFQEAVTDVLVAKARGAAAAYGANALCLGGGVAANSRLRERVAQAGAEDGIEVVLPSRAMCTDNAAMMAVAGWWRLRSDGPSGLDAGAHPVLPLPVLG